MKILIYGINYSPELTGTGKYTGEMAEWLAKKGHKVRVVTAPPYYPEWKVHQGYSRWFRRSVEHGVDVIRCPLYVPENPSALRRLLHLVSFSFSSLLPVLSQFYWKPDLVIQVVPTLFCSLQSLMVSRLSSSQCVVHIQDYEVDALFGLGIGKDGILKRVAFSVERWLLNRFDRVSTISDGMLKRATDKRVDKRKLIFFPNWSDLNRFQVVKRDNSLLESLGLDPLKRVILYSGNMGEKQGLELVIEAALLLKDSAEIHFLIVGSGAAKKRLIAQAESFALKNITFAPLQPHESLPTLLASADCHLVVQKRGAADAVLPSKLTNILAVGGNAVITADTDTTLGLLCDRYPGIAQCVEPESVNALVAGIQQVLSWQPVNVVAKDYAAMCLDKEVVLTNFVNAFES